jgi:hypothetical protein
MNKKESYFSIPKKIFMVTPKSTLDLKFQIFGWVQLYIAVVYGNLSKMVSNHIWQIEDWYLRCFIGESCRSGAS